MKLPSFFRQTDNPSLNLIVSLLLLNVFALRIVDGIQDAIGYGYDSFAYSEFMINFQGGFVRRGLIGQLIYHLYSATGIPLRPFIAAICYMAFIFVVVFFFRKFRERNYSWWILLSPLFLDSTAYVIRKDFILYIILIGIFYLLRNPVPPISKRISASLLVILSLFIHEAFIFWGFPIFALLLISYNRERILNRVLVLLPLITFGILCVYKGTPETVLKIIESWNSIIPGSPIVLADNSIGAIGWSTRQAFIIHFCNNTDLPHGYSGLILYPLYVLGGYYMFTNFITVFYKGSPEKGKEIRLCVSLCYSLLTICLLPMYTVLSCDCGRLFQYTAIATFGSLLIIPTRSLISVFPEWYAGKINNLNIFLNRCVIPTKGTMILLLFLLGMTPSVFDLYENWNYSITGSIFREISVILQHFLLNH